MKKNLQKKFSTTIFFITLIIIITSFNQRVNACVDYHPGPYSTCVYDSFFNHIEVTVHNLHLFGGSIGDFCTCAFSSYYNQLTDVYYVAFVDSATGLPVDGFDVWMGDAGSTSGWMTIMPGTDWEGFVAAVNYAGLQMGKAVNLVVRGNLPAGYDFAALDSAVYATYVGTDKADPVTHAPTGAHQSVSGLGTITFQEVSPEYFSGITVPVELQVGVFPNPSSSQVIIRTNGTNINSVIVFNGAGERVFSNELLSTSNYILNVQHFKAGVYHLQLQTSKGILQKKIIVQ